jgi:hypothetical protein
MATKFESSLWLREGPFMMRTVDSIDEAIAFLEHYHGHRGGMYHHARLMLEGSQHGSIAIADARKAFSAFAEDNNLLWREFHSLMVCGGKPQLRMMDMIEEGVSIPTRSRLETDVGSYKARRRYERRRAWGY